MEPRHITCGQSHSNLIKEEQPSTRNALNMATQAYNSIPACIKVLKDTRTKF